VAQTHLRNLLLLLHIAALACAAGLGAWGIADTIRLAGRRTCPFSLERGGISVGFLSLATIYARHCAPARLQSHRPASLVVSLLAVALLFSNVRWAAKGFPPSESPGRQRAISALWWRLLWSCVRGWSDAPTSHRGNRSETRVLIMRSPNPRLQRPALRAAAEPPRQGGAGIT